MFMLYFPTEACYVHAIDSRLPNINIKISTSKTKKELKKKMQQLLLNIDLNARDINIYSERESDQENVQSSVMAAIPNCLKV